MLLGALGVIGDLLAAQRTSRSEPSSGSAGSSCSSGSSPRTTSPGTRRAPRNGSAWSGEHTGHTAVPTGNTSTSTAPRNPVVRRLMAGFELALDELFTLAAPSRSSNRLRRGGPHRAVGARLGDGRVVGLDLADEKLEASGADVRGQICSSSRATRSRACRTPTGSSTWSARPRCSSTCRRPSASSRRWPGWRRGT